MAGLFGKLFKSHSEKEVKSITPLCDAVEALEEKYKRYTDDELKGMTEKLKARLQNGETTDDILPDAFATVREAASRVLGMRHYRVQIIGGIILHQGRIAEMRTGEGKTLVSTLPAYLNALTGKGVHIVTVNDYLARRDSEWMGKVHRFLGLTVGVAVHGITPAEKREAYKADITYGTNNEMGFDYLRDNMVVYKQDMVQREFHYAIIDEVDSILIDEARTPLIISGRGQKSTELYAQADRFASGLKCMRVAKVDEKAEISEDTDADYIVDEKARTATLTPRGVEKAERAFGIENLTDPEHTTLTHHINQAIKARGVMQRDVDYVVRDNQVMIVDEFTGRIMFGRRYSEGLHQAIEAKEHVKIENENRTLATITFQNYFRLYPKLAGMTGTALTEEDEFRHIYKLDVVEIPTNMPMIRHDNPDVVYKTEAGKFRAVIARIIECHEKGQPVLVGTVSIEKSELLSKLLKKSGVQHEVLNAKYHEKEADIIAQAGKFKAVTIATNMAGRGTDIMLGGNAEYMARHALLKEDIPEEIIAEAMGYAETDNEEIIAAREAFKTHYDRFKMETSKDGDRVREAGGLMILGTERHESRRIDNQLRGRAGRQGDPGESAFYISLEDDLMRLFGSERVANMMNVLGIDEDMPIEQKILSNAIETAQKQIESRNFQIRKNVLQYDDVMNHQREIIYKQRRQVLDGENLKDNILRMLDGVIENAVDSVCGTHEYVDTWQIPEITKPFENIFIAPGEIAYTRDELNTMKPSHIKEDLKERALSVYAKREAEFGETLMRELERVVLLRNVDLKWMEHIDAMHEFRQSVYLRAYGQVDPVIEYKREGQEMFEEMVAAIRTDTVRSMYTVRVNQGEPQRERVANPNEAISAGGEPPRKEPVKREKKPGRNDPCPCGSGKKYKKCCGLNES